MNGNNRIFTSTCIQIYSIRKQNGYRHFIRFIFNGCVCYISLVRVHITQCSISVLSVIRLIMSACLFRSVFFAFYSKCSSSKYFVSVLVRLSFSHLLPSPHFPPILFRKKKQHKAHFIRPISP